MLRSLDIVHSCSFSRWVVACGLGNHFLVCGWGIIMNA